jgi:predicted RNA binding protein YcfA (HicA-like mRNA interferase family)
MLAAGAGGGNPALLPAGLVSVVVSGAGATLWDVNHWSEGVSYTHPQFGLVCKIHTMKSADLCRLLERAGWVLTRTRGSHRQYTKDGRTVTVPHPKKDLGIGLVRAIRKQAGI